jgi:Ras GTPase-activating-like protein IQGAP2/3
MQRLNKNMPKRQDSVKASEEFGRKGPQFLTMTRADFAAYEYLCRQAEAKEWIEAVTGETLESPDLWKSLGNGVVLCKLANCMWPGCIPKWNPPNSFHFKLIENIELFLQVVSQKGLIKEDTFTALDLFEKKNMPLVLSSIYKLAGKNFNFRTGQL